MLKFFRRIRQTLMTENKFSKYLIYAFGEILLVVIGILIALQINNWNDRRLAFENTELLLSKVLKELATNINNTKRPIEFYWKENSLVYDVLEKKLSYEDYKADRSLTRVLLTYESADLVDEAFQNLMTDKGKLSDKQDSIISKLITLYDYNKKNVSLYEEKVDNYVLKNMQDFAETKPWFGRDFYLSNELSDEAIAYFLNDPIYYNKVLFYVSTNLGIQLGEIMRFRHKALDLYSELSDYLNAPQDSSVAIDLTKYEHFMGQYLMFTNEGDSIAVRIEKDKGAFMLDAWLKKDSTLLDHSRLYPYTDSTFTLNRGYFGAFKFNDRHEVTGFTTGMGRGVHVFTKVQ